MKVMLDEIPEPVAPTLQEIDAFTARINETMRLSNMADAIRNYSQNLITRLVAYDNRVTCQMGDKEIDFIDYLPIPCDAPPPAACPAFDFGQSNDKLNVMATSSAALVDICQSWSGESVLLASQDMTFFTPLSALERRAAPRCIKLPGDTGYSHASAFHPSDRLVALSKAGMIHLYDLRFNDMVASIPAHSSVITGLAFSSTGSVLVSCGKDRHVVTQDMVKSKTVFDLTMPSPMNTMAKMRDGSVVALGMENGFIHLFDSRMDKSGLQFEAHAGSVSDIAFNNGCDMLASVGTDRVLQVFDVRSTVQSLRSFKRHLEFPLATTFDGDGRVWSGTVLGELQAWNVNDGTSVLREPITRQPIYALSFSEARNSIMYLMGPSSFIEKPVEKVEFTSSRSFVLKWVQDDHAPTAQETVP